MSLPKNNISVELISGTYEYSIHGRIIESSSGEGNGITSGTFRDDFKAKDKIVFVFNDFEKAKWGDVKFELVGDKLDKAKWHLSNKEVVRLGKYDPSFTIPLRMSFTKIE